MPIIKVNKKYQITIPISVRKELNISAGDILEAQVTKTKDGVIYKLKRMSEEEIASYWMESCREEGEVELSEFGRQELGESLAEVKEGKIKKFDNLDDLIKDTKEFLKL